MIHIVLFEPEIPQNTGNIMRTCVATKTILHIIKPIGFSLDDKQLKRSGMDYIHDLTYYIYENYDDFESKNKGNYYFITRYGKKTYSDVDYSNPTHDIYLIFGKESTGIPKERLKQNLNRCLRIPIASTARSLNLSNAVAIVLFEVLRQQHFNHLSKVERIKGPDFLENHSK